VWREALLAQNVLRGSTKGYRNHPQLERFKDCPDPRGGIAEYLRGIYAEASSRGYKFDKRKIGHGECKTIICTRGQILYEWSHLKRKLKVRDRGKYRDLANVKEPEPHPLFKIIEGPIEPWERSRISTQHSPIADL
jgi:hypothetical protein